MAENFGTCFYVLSRLVPAPVQRLYGQYFGENLDKVNPSRAKLTKFQKDNIDKELVTAIRGEILPDGKWTLHAEADDVRKLIEKGAANTQKDRAGGTPLHECCHMGLVEHAKAILETYPKEALKQDRFGRTPMQYAIESKKLDAVEMLTKFQPIHKLGIYKWIAINRTDYDFAMKVFNLLSPEDIKTVIKHDENLLTFEQRKNVNDRLKPFIRMHLE